MKSETKTNKMKLYLGSFSCRVLFLSKETGEGKLKGQV